MTRPYTRRLQGATPISRATDRGIPQPLTDALLAVLAVDEADLTLDSTLVADLGADEVDLCELALALTLNKRCGTRFEDEVLDDWETATLGAIVNQMKRHGATL